MFTAHDFLYITESEQLEKALEYYSQNEEKFDDYGYIFGQHPLFTWEITKKIILANKYHHLGEAIPPQHNRQAWELVKNEPESYMNLIYGLFVNPNTDIHVLKEISEYDWESLDEAKLQENGISFKPHGLEDNERALLTYVSNPRVTPLPLPPYLGVMSIRYLGAVAENPNMSGHDMEKIWEYLKTFDASSELHQEGYLKTRIARNPATPYHVVAEIRDKAIAAQMSVPDSDITANRKLSRVIWASYRNPATPTQYLEELLDEQDSLIKSSIERRIISVLGTREDLSEATMWKIYDSNRDFSNGFGQHPNLPYEIMEKMIEKGNILGVYRNRSLPVTLVEEVIRKAGATHKHLIKAGIAHFNQQISEEYRINLALQTMQEHDNDEYNFGVALTLLQVCPNPQVFLEEKTGVNEGTLDGVPQKTLWEMVRILTDPKTVETEG